MPRSLVCRQRPASLVVLIALLAGIFNVTAQNILREYWLNIPGSSVPDLTANPAYPYSPSGHDFRTLFEGPTSWADNYGTRMRGYVKPPTTGNYTFWIAGDDNCELWLSTDSSPSNARLIATVPGWTTSRQWEDVAGGNAPYQKSVAIPLVSGQKYYVEALHKEGGGGDCVAVGWQLPTGAYERPIPGTRLEAYVVSTNPPSIQTQPADLTVYQGQEARFSVVATGMDPMTFQWQRDGVDLPIEHSATLILVSPELQDSGAKYRCVIANAKGTQTSREATLTVLPEITPPIVVALAPAANSTVRSLTQVEVSFSEPVQGVDASDLLINGVAATEVTGVASGPYVFKFAPIVSGTAAFSFASDHGIRDLSLNENAFAGSGWSCVVDPNLAAPKVRISEIDASNENGLLDEDGEAVDWIELENYGTTPVNLNGWALSDSKSDPAEWVFPNVTIAAGSRLVVFASGKDRRPANGKLHANFLLAGGGEFLGLFDANSPRELISALDPFPEQRVDYSYGLDTNGDWKYFKTPTPSAANGTSSIVGIMSPPHFSSERGFYNSTFQVYLTTDQPDADIYYSRNGGDPSGASGILYTGPITVTLNTVLCASVVKPNYLPSAPVTHTYLDNIAAARRSLPALSIVTATNNLFGPTGIIGISGGTYGADGVWQPTKAGDYHNPSQHGLAWERPTSIEFFYPTNNDQFQVDCGIRIQGSDYLRPRYTPSSKFSYRFYFRGDYGSGKLEYPLFDGAVTSFDQLVLRAGHNDDTNPFLKDELMRRLMIDCGQVGSHGVFLTMYLNGAYKGYFNLVERIEKHFCQAWHGSTAEWDVLEQNQQPLDGDNLNFSAMMSFVRSNSMTNSANYQEMSRRLDLTNFVDYLLVNVYGANGDWPGNNWRAGRERTPNGIWRFYLWDAEFAFGTYGQSYTWDTFANQLSEGSEIPTIYKALTNSADFRLLWADRVQKHFYNGGALSDSNILRNFNTLKSQLSTIITGFDSSIASSWIPNRRKTVTNLFRIYGLAGAPGAPSFNQFGGRTPAGFQLTMNSTATGPDVAIYYTTDGSDPRVKFTGDISPTAQQYSAPITLIETTVVKARMRTNSVWSAVTEATFEVSEFGAAVRFTEINYNPPGGDAYEFIELKNFSGAPVNLGGMTFEGINYRFPEPTILGSGQVVVIASGASPAAFAKRYPGVTVAGYFSNSSLSNGGERVVLKDKAGNIVASVDYHDDSGWPVEADGGGYSLELADRELDPNSPAAWRKSKALFGSPGQFNEASQELITLNEIMPVNASQPAWIELFNSETEAVSLAKYAIGDANNLRRYVFADTAAIPAGGYFVASGFPIGLGGGTLFLTDDKTNRIDAVVLGRQLAGYSLARIDGVWTLGIPTSAAANVAAQLAPAGGVVINEWLANAPSGGDDWLELHNTGSAPVALQGMTLSASNAVYRIPTLSFIPAGGFAQFFAAEKVGPDQLAFKLPASGGTIRLYDASGAQVNSVTYGTQIEGVSEGRIPDGSTTISKFRASATPGASNYVVNASSSLVINEVMARNTRAVIDPFGGTADWIELYNSGAPVSLEGFTLSANDASAGQWTFPPGVTLPTDGYLVVWFDKANPPTTSAGTVLNTGRALSADGGGVYLFNQQGQIVDQIEYGIQAADLPIGRIGVTWNLLMGATPGLANTLPAEVASSTTMRINEWSGGSANSPGWIELFNSNSIPVAIGGMSLTDQLNLAGLRKFVLPDLSYLGPKQFVKLATSQDKAVDPGEINFGISALGESVRLYTSSGTVVDTVSFGALPENASLARIPDAGTNVVEATASAGAGNYIDLTSVVLSEVSFPNKVELRNFTATGLDVSGWTLSDGATSTNVFVLPTNSVVRAGGYFVITLPNTLTLDTNFGGTIVLSRVLEDGTPTGEQSRLNYEAAPTASFGRLQTSMGVQSRAEFGSLGYANVQPLGPSIVISEIMYHPADDDLNSEYVTIFNAGGRPITADWRINGGVQFNFPPLYTIPATGSVVLVHFDPADTATRQGFAARYHLPTNAVLMGPLRGKLSNEGDQVVLEELSPLTAQGVRPVSRVDFVSYGPSAPWPTAANGASSALRRIRAEDFGNEPLNWMAAAPSPGTFSNGEQIDRDGDGLPDVWEIQNGLNIYDASDAVADSDGDGLTNFSEFQLGTDPADATSGLRMEVTSFNGQQYLLFTAAPMHSYVLEYRESLTEGAWTRESVLITSYGENGLVSIGTLGDTKQHGFFRIRFEPPQ